MVEPSIWPVLTAIGGFLFTSGLAFYMHRVTYGGFLFIVGFLILLLSAYFWFAEIINEATFLGHHTQVVRFGLKSGFLLFIASEIMLFFGFFWAFFHSSMSPSILLGGIWPPSGLVIISVVDYPLLNTGLLIVSGLAVTWVHRGVALGLFKESIDGFLVTIVLGLFFIFFQGIEYYEASFSINDSIYASTFYMLTGLHGCHVIVGVIFLLVNFKRLLLNHFLTNHYLGLVFAIWYWHFVDVVWILLFLTVYCWGSW
jgi:cytochrome c oxidase subunit 3